MADLINESIDDLVRISYGDNHITMFNRHAFVWDIKDINGITILDGNLISECNALTQLGKIGAVIPLKDANRESISEEIDAYIIIGAEIMEKALNLVTGEVLLSQTIYALKPDDTLLEIKARISFYKNNYPYISFKWKHSMYKVIFKDNLPVSCKSETNVNRVKRSKHEET